MEPRRRQKPPRRASYHHGDLRRALLETALALVAEKGERGFSLREAARVLGVSPAAVYRHFASKEDLLKAVSHDGHRHLAQLLQRARDDAKGPPGSQERAIDAFLKTGEAYSEFAVRHPSHFRVLFTTKIDPQDVSAGGPDGGVGPYQVMVEVLDDLVAAKVIEPGAREGAEIAVWSLSHGFANLLVDGTIAPPPGWRIEAGRLMAGVLLRGMGAAPSSLPKATLAQYDPTRDMSCNRNGAERAPRKRKK